jgi:hypothetical protein
LGMIIFSIILAFGLCAFMYNKQYGPVKKWNREQYIWFVLVWIGMSVFFIAVA